MSWRLIEGDCIEQMQGPDAGCVQTCVTSPPYFGLRDYGHAGQIGLEASPNPEYAQLARARIIGDAPLLNAHAEAAA